MRCSDPAIQPTTGRPLPDPRTGYRRSRGLPVPLPVRHAGVGRTVEAWTAAPRSASSSAPAEPGSPPNRPASPPTPARAGCRGYAARKSPSSPGSASTTTSAWSGAAPRPSPNPSWTPSPARCSWTTPNGPTCSISLSPPPAGRGLGGRPARSGSARSCTRLWTPSASPRSSKGDAWTSWQLTELIGELSVHSDTFRRLWADHDVLAHSTGTKRLHHPLVGDLTLDYVVLAVEADPDQTLVILTPEPASPSAEALNILASWTSPPLNGPRATERTQNPASSTPAITATPNEQRDR